MDKYGDLAVYRHFLLYCVRQSRYRQNITSINHRSFTVIWHNRFKSIGKKTTTVYRSKSTAISYYSLKDTAISHYRLKDTAQLSPVLTCLASLQKTSLAYKAHEGQRSEWLRLHATHGSLQGLEFKPRCVVLFFLGGFRSGEQSINFKG